MRSVTELIDQWIQEGGLSDGAIRLRLLDRGLHARPTQIEARRKYLSDRKYRARWTRAAWQPSQALTRKEVMHHSSTRRSRS